MYPEPKEDQLTKEQMKKLIDYGFSELKNKNKTYEFTYGVSCNQDDVLQFLLENNIPFEAECHYGHYNVFYWPKKDTIIEAYNFGCEISTYGLDSALEYFDDDILAKERKQGVKKFTRQGYLDHIKY